MPKTKTTSPARSQGGATTPKRKTTRGSRSLCSPALSTASGRLTSLIDQYKDKKLESFALSPLNGRSVLNDNTEIEEPRRKSWWKKLDENSQDVMEVLEDNRLTVNNAIEEFIDIEVLSQEKKNYTLDLPESSDNESINSIVLPQRRLFTQKENQAQKKFGHLIDNRESLAKLHKTNPANSDKTINVGTRELFQNTKRSKPIFPASLLNISSNKTTAEKTRENALADPKPQVRNIFGNRPANKRKNMFADFIVSESEDEIPEIQPKVFGFQKKLEQRRISSISKGRDASPTSSITTDFEMDFRMLLPSSTMVENQLEDNIMFADNTPIKRARLSKLSEAKESEAGTLQTNTTSDKTKQSNKSVASKNKSKASPELKHKSLNSSRTTRSMLKNASKREEQINTTSDKTKQSNKSVASKNKSKTSPELKDKSLNSSRTTSQANEEEINEIQEEAVNESQKVETEISQGEDEEEANENSEDKGNENQEVEAEVIERQDIEEEANESQDVEAEVNESQTVEEETNESHEIEEQANESQAVVDAHASDKENDEAMDEDKKEIANKNQVRENQSQKVENDKEKCHEVVNESQKIEKETNEGQGIEEEANESQEIVDAHASNEETNEGMNEDEEETDNESQVHGNESQEAENDKEASHEVVNESQEIEAETNINQEDEEEASESQEIEAETNESQEDEEEANESQEIEAETNESQEDEEEANESQEIEAETNESLEDEDEANESQEIEAETNESQGDEEEANESQEIEAETNESQGDEEEANESQEIDEEAHESQEVSDAHASVEENDEGIDEDEEETANDSQAHENESQEVENDEEEIHEVVSEAESEEVEDDQQMDDSNEADKEIASDPEISDDNQADEMEVDDDEGEQESDNEESKQNEHESHEETQILEQNEIEPSEEIEESPNVTHDTTGRYRKKNLNKSPEVILHDKTNQNDSFTAKGRNTSIRKTKSMIKNLNIRPSLAPSRESAGFSDGTRNSSAEGSGWDSHRTTRKTLRQTFGKDFTPRKSLRALVMEKSAKRQTEQLRMHSETVRLPLANSTEMPEDSNHHVEDIVESDHEVSRRMRQTTLEMYLQKMKEQNIERRLKMEVAVRNSLKNPITNSLSLFKVPNKPAPRRPKSTQTKAKKPLKSIISIDDLPSEVIEDMKYKPPKRFQPPNASWITKRLYKYLENKLEAKYDYKARVRAEKLVETIYLFAKDLRRHDVAPTDAVDVLKHELARLEVVRTHFEFYEFFHEFMPREVRIKVVPDIVNKIALPRHGPFSDILRGNTAHE